MAETIFKWIFLFASACALIFSYGIVEDLIRQGLRSCRSKKMRESHRDALLAYIARSAGDGHGETLLH